MEFISISNEDIFALKVWTDNQLFMVVPKEDWMDVEYPIPASSLTFDKFEEYSLTENELDDFNSFIAAVPTPSIN